MEDNGNPRTILIVDDHQGLIALIQRCLARDGYHTAVASSGREALSWLSHHTADLLLLNLQLADMTGEHFINQLDARALTLPFIVVTGHGDELLAVKMMKRGAQDYCIKDSSLIELLPSIVAQTFNQIQQEHRLVLTEKALQTERERMPIAFGSIIEGVLTTDTMGRITYMNPMAEELSGWTQQQATGRPIEEIVRFPQDGLSENRDHPVMQVLRHGLSLHPRHPTALYDRTLRERPVIYSASPLRWSDGNVLGTVLILRDMTERIQLVQELLKAGTLDSLGRLAWGIAHDFNNLLTGILANLSTIQTRMSPHDDLSSFVAQSECATLRAKALTFHLLPFVRGGTPLKKPLDLQQTISESATFALSGSSTQCHCEIPDDIWQIDADEAQIGQVVHHLALNAHQAMPTGGTLSICVENTVVSQVEATRKAIPTPGHYVKLTFQDCGYGIPPQEISKIFDPYFTTKPNGCGLGLSTAYSVIKNHQGSISASSIPGRGTTLTIYLPAYAEASTTSASSASGENREGRILVMDDEESIRLLLGEMLRHLGYEAQCVAGGKEALARYREAWHAQRPFSAVILDLTVPGELGGKDVIRQLQEFDPHVKAIVASGYCHDQEVSTYSAFGFHGVVAKPFRLTELSRVLQQVTE
jgi:two-component system, cell cycle sensor histidine kinase and response regulator CckA